MARMPRVPRSLTATVACLIVAAGCTPGVGSSSDDDDTAAASPSPVTAPPERRSPFCEAMIALADRLDSGDVADTAAEIVSTYERIAPDVPDEIREDFDAVLSDLRSGPSLSPSPVSDPSSTSDTSPAVETFPATSVGSVPSTVAPGTPTDDETTSTTGPAGDEFFDEGYTPDDDPALRLNAYVDFTCRDVFNNPGPPATQPLSEP